MFKALKSIFPNSPFVNRTKDFMVTSLTQLSSSPLKLRFPSRNQRRHQQTIYLQSYHTTGMKDDIKGRRPRMSNSYKNAGRRQSYTYDYSNRCMATATSLECRLRNQYSSPNCLPSSVKKTKDNVSQDHNRNKVLSNNPQSHCLQVTTGSTMIKRNNVDLHRIPTGPTPSPPREPTYPPTCPPSLAPQYPAPTPNPYCKPRPVNSPEHSRQRCDVPVCPPCTVYPNQPPSTNPKCRPMASPLKDVHLPKRNPKPKASYKEVSSFRTKVFRQAHNNSCYHFHHRPQYCLLRHLPLRTLIRFVR